MTIHPAKRLDGIGEYYFSIKLKEIAGLNAAGADVINLGIGSPDLPPHPSVIATLQDTAQRPAAHGYQGYKGVDALRIAFGDWYQRSYNVTLNPATEILPLIGSKEGIMHICMTYLNEGDQALIPNPGYPTYSSAVRLAGGQPLEYALRKENGYQPDLAALAKMNLDGVKLMFLNYPHMPTGARGSKEIFNSLVSFARDHNILLVHDNPYSFILNEHPASLLSTEGAMDVAIELNSLSKSHNMAGWRIGMVAGAAERIDEILKFKSNMDSGMFLPIQLAAVRALHLDSNWYEEINDVYTRRRDAAKKILEHLQCVADDHQSGLFLWAAIPGRYTSGYELSDEILQKAGVFITPGGIFGSEGEKCIRISLCSTEEKLAEALERIKKAGL